MAYKLTTENVNLVENEILNAISYWGSDEKEASRTLAYISGVHEMANAVRRAINDLGGA